MAQAIFEKVPIAQGQSFAWRASRARFTMPWHFHPEYELTHIIAGRGMRHVGDSMERFEPGDLVLLGKNLPHYWWQDAGDVPGRSVVLQFAETVPGASLWDLPECRQVRGLLDRAQQGIVFPLEHRSRDSIAILQGMKELQGWRRVRALLDLLGTLAESPDGRLLASKGFSPSLKVEDGSRMKAVCAYVNAAFTESISHAKAARLAGLSPSAFSRFFHRRAGKTFEAYVNEIRIGHACRFLDDEDSSITEIAFRAGFNNLSNFHRRFRQITGMAPRAYRQAHRCGLQT